MRNTQISNKPQDDLIENVAEAPGSLAAEQTPTEVATKIADTAIRTLLDLSEDELRLLDSAEMTSKIANAISTESVALTLDGVVITQEIFDEVQAQIDRAASAIQAHNKAVLFKDIDCKQQNLADLITQILLDDKNGKRHVFNTTEQTMRFDACQEEVTGMLLGREAPGPVAAEVLRTAAAEEPVSAAKAPRPAAAEQTLTKTVESNLRKCIVEQEVNQQFPNASARMRACYVDLVVAKREMEQEGTSSAKANLEAAEQRLNKCECEELVDKRYPSASTRMRACYVDLVVAKREMEQEGTSSAKANLEAAKQRLNECEISEQWASFMDMR